MQEEIPGLEAMATPAATGRVGALFAGIGGIELGLARAGYVPGFFCEIEPAAQAVLQRHFPKAELHPDVRELVANAGDLPDVDIVTGGFPCQDLSQAGRTAGIRGERSGLVTHMLDLMDELQRRPHRPTWLLIENVENMLRLDGGEAMRYLTNELSRRGYRWAYRLVDSRAFGLAQRRERVFMLASREEDPAPILFSQEAGEPPNPTDWRAAGFYWTEGLRGLGWAYDAVPTLKGGSGLGIPSPPAIWTPEAPRNPRCETLPEFGTVHIEDGELLQGFEPGWTDVELSDGTTLREGDRWKMVGNAVSVNAARWVGQMLHERPDRVRLMHSRLHSIQRWPNAAFGDASGQVYAVEASKWPVRTLRPSLPDTLRHPPKPLSLKAAIGFRERTMRGSLNFVNGFIEALDQYIVDLGGDLNEVAKLSLERKRAAEIRRQNRASAARSAQPVSVSPASPTS